MTSCKYVLPLFILLLLGGCFPKNPYKTERIVFLLQQRDLKDTLHSQFHFEDVIFKGISVKFNGPETIELNLKIDNPQLDSGDVLFAKKFAQAVKPYIKNINHFNVISVDTKVRSNSSFGYTERTKKTLLDQSSLNEISVADYFHLAK
jgi:hypothetical protein